MSEGQNETAYGKFIISVRKLSAEQLYQGILNDSFKDSLYLGEALVALGEKLTDPNDPRWSIIVHHAITSYNCAVVSEACHALAWPDSPKPMARAVFEYVIRRNLHPNLNQEMREHLD